MEETKDNHAQENTEISEETSQETEIQKLKERAEVAEKTWYNCAKWLAGDKDAENPKKIRR